MSVLVSIQMAQTTRPKTQGFVPPVHGNQNVAGAPPLSTGIRGKWAPVTKPRAGAQTPECARPRAQQRSNIRQFPTNHALGRLWLAAPEDGRVRRQAVPGRSNL